MQCAQSVLGESFSNNPQKLSEKHSHVAMMIYVPEQYPRDVEPKEELVSCFFFFLILKKKVKTNLDVKD